jgi:outer membrane protein assembly factor BamB
MTGSGAGGTERWSVGTGDRVVSSPTVVDGTVYVGSYDGHVYALGMCLPRGLDGWHSVSP